MSLWGVLRAARNGAGREAVVWELCGSCAVKVEVEVEVGWQLPH
jgi:hypothetical protein